MLILSAVVFVGSFIIGQICYNTRGSKYHFSRKNKKDKLYDDANRNQ